MFRSWQNNLQNLNEYNEAVTFLNVQEQQRSQFRNKIENKFKYLNNLSDVYYKENETSLKIVKNLKRSRDDINKTLLVYKKDVKRINLLQQNNKIIAQYKQKMAENAERIKQNLKKIDSLKKFRVEFNEKERQIVQNIGQILVNLQQQRYTDLQQGLGSEIFEKFSLFTADESHVGDQCSNCMEDFKIKKNMMRLNCDGKHAFCQVCIEGWFADHRRCPICRHMF